MRKSGPKYLLTKNKLFQIYLIGIKGFFENKRNLSYNFPKTVLLLTLSPTAAKYTLKNWKTEFETLENPNFLIPKLIYNSRLDHYKYWELSRLARKKKNIFSHYFYDPKSDFNFYVDKEGQKTEKNNLNFEKLENKENPTFEKFVRKFKNDGCLESLKNCNLLIAYNKNIFNPVDLNNYLGYKTVNLADWARGLFWGFMVYSKFTNYYRYDHILGKNDLFYEYEKLKFALNLGNKSLSNDKIKKYKMIHDFIFI